MRKYTIRLLATGAVATAALALSGCKGGDSPLAPADDDPDPIPLTYAERISAGWAHFTAGNYSTARSTFLGATTFDPGPADAYAGLGWSELQLDDLQAAHDAFSTGSGKTAPDEVLADLHAGWAFAWNARKTAPDNYAESNARITDVESLEPAWSFDHLPALDSTDLTLLAAENYFALGQFDSSLARVQLLDAAFVADVATAEGQAALATRIEELRTG